MDSIEVQNIDKRGWQCLGGGAILALILLTFPFISFILSYLVVLVHELGHAVFGWLFGYPSIPAFDFVYGGGVTTWQSRKIAIVVVVYVIMLGAIAHFYRIYKIRIALGAILVVYSIFAFTRWHNILILFMGHGMELVFAAIFLYRAMSGSAIVHSIERPLYGMLGFFIIFHDMRFAYRLMTSAYHRAEYANAKGGGHWMDFSRISQQTGFSLTIIALFFLLCCILPAIISFLFHRYRRHIPV